MKRIFRLDGKNVVYIFRQTFFTPHIEGCFIILDTYAESIS